MAASGESRGGKRIDLGNLGYLPSAEGPAEGESGAALPEGESAMPKNIWSSSQTLSG
jgi:hypothetical protein